MRAAIAVLLLAAACGDNLRPPCPDDGADRHTACQAACKTGDPAGDQTCDGATVEACLAECEACAPEGAWCPGPLPACAELCGAAAFCNVDRSACSCIPPGEVDPVACDGQPAGGQ